MKVLLVLGAFPPMKATEADHAYHLARHLASAGLDVHVLTTRRDDIAQLSNVRVHAVMHHWEWRDIPKYVSFLTRERPDAILFLYLGWIYNAHPMTTYLATLSKLVLPRCVFVTQYENIQGAKPGNWNKASRALRKVDGEVGRGSGL